MHISTLSLGASPGSVPATAMSDLAEVMGVSARQTLGSVACPSLADLH